MKSAWVLLSLAVTLGAPAALATPASLEGTWILEKSENPMPDGSLVPYCTGVHGLIIYTAEGYVSVALNCSATAPKPEPADVSGRKFFYAGTYSFDGSVVTHRMLNASQPELIGEMFSREVAFNGSQLVLTGVNQGQKFSAYWRRVGQ